MLYLVVFKVWSLWILHSMSSKKKKKTGLDRISLLPDSLLHSILSLLNTRQVVQTCVLSKRWKTIWTDIPTLNFDFDSYPFKQSIRNSSASNPKEPSFERFILRVLSEHGCKNIITLNFSCSRDSDDTVSLVEWLICYASHVVQELCISTYKTIYYNWPCGLSTCSSLLVLKIKCGFVDDCGALKSASLRILEIECDWGDRYDRKYNEIEMFSGCPNLESLVLVNYLFDSATISAPKLENLELCASSEWPLSFPQVELFAPSLKTLKFGNVLPTLKSASKFACIHKVNIQVEDCNLEGSHKKMCIQNFSRLLRQLHKARSFTLPLNAMEVSQISWSFIFS